MVKIERHREGKRWTRKPVGQGRLVVSQQGGERLTLSMVNSQSEDVKETFAMTLDREEIETLRKFLN